MRLDGKNLRERVKGTLIEVLEIEFIETDDPKTFDARMQVVPKLAQTMGVMHGGATISLAESVAGVGSNIICAEDEECFGIQISANHIASAKMGDTVIAKGVVMHKGRSTHVWNVDVISETTGRLISSIRVTNAVLKVKK